MSAKELPCPFCDGTGSVGSCDPADLEPDQSPLEAWGYGCEYCCDAGVLPVLSLRDLGDEQP